MRKVLLSGVIFLSLWGRAAEALTQRVSEVGAGLETTDLSLAPTIDDFGRYIAFESYAPNLVEAPELTPRFKSIFRTDRNTGLTVLVSVAPGLVAPDGDSYNSSISGNGLTVAFESRATNLITNDSNGREDIFYSQVATSLITRVSISTNGVQANNTSFEPSISQDASLIAFGSYATNLIDGFTDNNNRTDLFVRDISKLTTTRITNGLSNAQANGDSFAPAVSKNTSGRYYVAFESRATNLVVGDTNNAYDIFVYDSNPSGSPTISRVSVGVGGAQANGSSYGATISNDGRYVAFYSTASNLVSGDTNNQWDVFVHDRSTGVTSIVSKTSSGTLGNALSWYPDISGAGNFITYYSLASNFSSNDTNQAFDVFLYDRLTGVTKLLSTGLSGPANDSSQDPVLSGDGKQIAYWSFATNLIPSDTNNQGDVFIYKPDPVGVVPSPGIYRPLNPAAGQQVGTSTGKGFLGGSTGAVVKVNLIPKDTTLPILAARQVRVLSDSTLCLFVPSTAVIGKAYNITVTVNDLESPLSNSVLTIGGTTTQPTPTYCDLQSPRSVNFFSP